MISSIQSMARLLFSGRAQGSAAAVPLAGFQPADFQRATAEAVKFERLSRSVSELRSNQARTDAAEAALMELRSVVASQMARSKSGGSNMGRHQSRDVYAESGIYETQNVYETRDVIETRDVTETRAVYETRDIVETKVTGTRNLSGFDGWDDSGIVEKATFTVRVGSGAVATVEFKRNEEIRVTINGIMQKFEFADANGQWRGGLVQALNSIQGLNASFGSGADAGKLILRTANNSSLTLGDGISTPLSQLGLAAGTTQAAVTGTEQVQVGTEEVVVGTEEVVVGTEQVFTGTEQVWVGAVRHKVGTEVVATGNAKTDPSRAAYIREVHSLLSDYHAALRGSGQGPNLLAGGSIDVLLGEDRERMSGSYAARLDLAQMTDTIDEGKLALALQTIDTALSEVSSLKRTLGSFVDHVMSRAGEISVLGYGSQGQKTGGSASGWLLRSA